MSLTKVAVVVDIDVHNTLGIVTNPSEGLSSKVVTVCYQI